MSVRSVALVGVGLLLACGGPQEDTTTAGAEISRLDPTGFTSPSLAIGGFHSCVFARRGVRCWGLNGSGQLRPPALRNPVQLAAGMYHSCAIDDDGAKCWGLNGSGQATVPELRRPRRIVAGYAHTCALDEDGATCWGDATYKQTTVPTTLRNIRQIGTGRFHTCALDDGGVTCWGFAAGGRLEVPVLVNPRQLTVGDAHACAIDDSGVKCWGAGGGTITVPPSSLKNPRQVSAGYMHTCALDDDGMKCWGSGSAAIVPPLRRPAQMGTGREHTCALDDDGMKCWGNNYYGQITVPQDLELAGIHACMPTPGGVRCVGDNERGQLGEGSDVDRLRSFTASAAVDLGVDFVPTQVALGSAFGCALAGGAVKCWGGNARGQLGLGDLRDRGALAGDMGAALPALRFDSRAPIAKLGVGASHACAMTESGELFCWGAGRSGKLGTEAISDVATPVRPRIGARIRDFAVGREHTCVLGDEVYCFGNNDSGQLGIGRVGGVGDRPGSMVLAPVRLGTNFRVASIAAGDEHVCALSTGGLVKCWGANPNGELGVGDTRDRGTSPEGLGDALPVVDLGRGQVAVALACGARHCCAKTTQNTLKCWGANASGQLGLGDVVPRGTSPDSLGDALPFVMTPPREKVLALDLAFDRTCARTESGLRCWGRNRAGELGYGDRDLRGGTLQTIPRLLQPLGI